VGPTATLIPTGNGAGSAADRFLDLPGTIPQDYAQHEPMALFPEPSSTIPNATLTQQRVLEGIRAPDLLGSDLEVDMPPYQRPPEPSVPWSDMMKFSPTCTAEQTHLSDQRVEPGLEQMPSPRPSDQFPVSISQRSLPGSSERSKDSPLRCEMLHDSVDPRNIMLPPRPVYLSQDLELELPATGSPRLLRPTQETQSSSKHHTNEINPVPNSEDDLLAIGIPMEQYKPRPSRSRSLKVSHEEPVDYSVRPEKAAKMTKRRKTTSAAAATRSSAALNSLSTPQKVRQICDMGFTPTSTGHALKQNNGDVTRTVDWLITNGMGEDELAQYNTPRKKPVSRAIVENQSNALENPSEMQTPTINKIEASGDMKAPTDTTLEPIVLEHASVDSHTRKEQDKSPKVQVVIPSKSPKAKLSKQAADPLNTTSKQVKRRKTTLDLPEPVPIDDIHFVAEAAPGKKKRGRPKKTDTAAMPSEIVQQLPPEAPSTRQDADSDEVLQTVEAHTAHATAPILPEIQTTGTVPIKAMPSTSKPDVGPPVVVSRTPEQTSKPSSHSPASKGKVLYRVGLSKRARIAPLLRTLKK
jgi:hypothetical protein